MHVQRRCGIGFRGDIMGVLRIVIMKMLMRRSIAMTVRMGVPDQHSLPPAQGCGERGIPRLITMELVAMVVAVIIMRALRAGLVCTESN